MDRSGKVLLAKAMSPERFLAWCRELPAGCMVATEACGGAHYVARRLRSLGLNARLISAHFAGPYRLAGKSGKNDANDAAAICEAASRPHMHFVPIKSSEQQGQMALHRLREGYKEERSACIRWLVQLRERAGWQKAVVALQQERADLVDDHDARNQLRSQSRASDFRGAHAPSCFRLLTPANTLLNSDVRLEMLTTG